MYAGISKSIGGGFRVGTYFRLNGRSRSVPVYTRAACESFRDELNSDFARSCAAAGIKVSRKTNRHNSLGVRIGRQVFGTAFFPYR